jgi:AcrR family transcriptional regulator
MGMSIPYEASGRRQQKARTRQALVEAARDLISSGFTPTVEEAAAKAEISRTTAYRYFPNQHALLTAAYPYLASDSLVLQFDSNDPGARLAQVIEAHTRLVLELEHQLRTMLRLSLDQDPDHRGRLLLRKGRAIGWIEEALEPLRDRFSAEDLRRLVLAIRSAAGIEALVWLKDVAGLSGNEAVELMRWSAHAMLRSALAEGPPASTASAPRSGRCG